MRDLAASLRLVLITDGSAAEGLAAWRRLLDAAGAALRGGVTALMIREKALTTKELYEFALDARGLTRDADALLFVNDRVDVALAVEADGVHLGWQSMPVERVRALLGRERLIGVSTHSPDEALAAQRAGADYVTFGPVYPTPSKADLVEVQGPEGIRRAREARVSIPLIGLGGIDASNAARVLRGGADGVAAIRAILAAAGPEEASRNLAAVEEGPPSKLA